MDDWYAEGTHLFWATTALAVVIVALTMCAPEFGRWLGW